MTGQNWLAIAEKRLKQADIPTARLDCLVLLEDLLGKDRAHLLAHPELKLTSEQEKVLNEQLERRAKHEPLAYIRGKTEFYGREFIVNAHTLEPRSETETMIDELKGLGFREQGHGVALVDVGTGSGAIAISAKLELPNASVFATDISVECITIAKRNAQNHQTDITFNQGNLLDPLALGPSPYTLLCNLPYVPDSHTINKAAMFEPRLAIFGGVDGLDLYRELFTQIGKLDSKPGHILTESLPFQHEELAVIAKLHGYSLQQTSDFIQMFTLAASVRDSVESAQPKHT